MTHASEIPDTALEIRLAARPTGWPTLKMFDVATVPVGQPAAGQALVRNLLMSVDPYMRGRMNDAPSYVPPFEVGQALTGAAVGEVIASRSDALHPGEVVLHNLGWREYAVLDASAVKKVDPQAAPLGAYLGVLGMTGLTAYAGLMDVARLAPGDAVFVSAAAGAVGSVAGQLARLKGAKRVIGSAGSAQKVRYLTEELGFDAAFNYHDGPVTEQLAAAAPEGIDVYFDNVGGDHLEAAIDAANVHARIVVCGMIAQYNASEPPAAPRNLAQVIAKRLRIQGMLVRDHTHLADEFLAEVGPWVREGRLKYTETVADGLPNAAQAFLDLLRGGNIGKMLVKIADR
jgi:NADPH-dependent curcumin reductase CurA